MEIFKKTISDEPPRAITPDDCQRREAHLRRMHLVEFINTKY